MSRFIDTLPEPAQKTSPKIFVLSASRTGTFGLFQAFRTLGYRPYHMVEICARGLEHIKIFEEAMNSTQPRFNSEVLDTYGRAEFDKWFAGYEVVIEMSSYLQDAVIQAYKDDPDVTFILTERDASGWARSMTNTVGRLITAFHKVPMSIFKYFDATNWEWVIMCDILWEIWSDGKGPTDPTVQESLRRNYTEYIDMVKRVTPPEKLHVFRLEEGLGWEQICPLLGHDIPDSPYPRGNLPAEFAKINEDFLRPGVNKAIMTLSAIAVPALGTAAWALIKYGPSIFSFARSSLKA